MSANPNNAQANASVLREELMKHRQIYVKALGFSLIVNLLILAPTFFMLEVYDRVVNSRNATTLAMLLLLVIGAYVMMELLDIVRGKLMHRAAEKVDEALRRRLFDAVFEAKLRGHPGTPIQPFADLKAVRDFMTSPPLMAMMDAPTSIVFLILIYVVSPWLGVMATIGAIVQVIVAIRTEKRTMPALTEANGAAMAAQTYASSTLRNAQVVEAMGMMGSLHKRWAQIQHDFLKKQAIASDHAGLNQAGSKFIQTMQGSMLLGASCWLSIKGQMLGGGGMMIVASTLGGRVLAPLGQLVAQWQLVVAARNAYKRLDLMLAAHKPRGPSMPLPPPTGKLTVENLLAAAPGSQVPILKGINFALTPGELMVLIGPSASGKTTLARLMMGIWAPLTGNVRLDGADVYSWNKDELGPHIGYLPQTVELFDGTVAENIARFGDLDMAKVQAAVEEVGLSQLIESLPMGFETRIGEEGSFLSGGQRQRLGLARALYGKPRFIVLDEPNSSLDEAGEAALLETLARVKAAKATVVVISHRLNILNVADKMMVLRDGQVAAFGPRDEVLAAMRAAAEQKAGQAPPSAPAGRKLALTGAPA
jgi:ATP-binding cassette subfamily C exporter for protease/lipase